MCNKKNTAKKLLKLLLCVLLCCSVVSGCGKKEPLQVWVSVHTTAGQGDQFAHLALYYLKLQDKSIEAEITVFQEELKEGQESAGFALTQTLLSSLMAGEGPDVILFTDVDFGDVQKLAESGAFLDLSGYLEQSEAISEADFVPGVFGSCKTDDAFFYVPLGYTVLSSVTSEEILTARGWNAPEDIGDLLEQIEAFSAEERDGTAFFNAFYESYDVVRDYPLRWMVEYSGIRLIDYDTGTVLPDEEALGRILRAYQPIWQVQREAEFLGYSMLTEGLLTQRELCFLYPFPSVALYGRCMVSGDLSTELQCLGGLDGSVTATVTAYAAINANSRSPEEAWKLIEMMLGKTMQDTILSQHNCLMELPVRLGSLDDYWLQYNMDWADSMFVDSNEGTHLSEPLDQETAARYARRCESAAVHYNSQTALDVLMEAMEPYLAGEAEYETCMEQLRNRLTLYAGE